MLKMRNKEINVLKNKELGCGVRANAEPLSLCHKWGEGFQRYWGEARLVVFGLDLRLALWNVQGQSVIEWRGELGPGQGRCLKSSHSSASIFSGNQRRGPQLGGLGDTGSQIGPHQPAQKDSGTWPRSPDLFK